MHNWHLVETSFDPQALHYKETVFTIGNGYLGTRGAFEEGFPGEQAMALIHGLFDNIPIVFTELVNTPNWLHLELFVNDERFRMDRGDVLHYKRELDLRSGMLKRQLRWRSPAGNTVDLEIERFTSLAQEHCMGIRFRATAVDFSGQLSFRAGLPGHVDNTGWVHWQLLDQGPLHPQSIYLDLQTKTTKMELYEISSLNVSGNATYEYWDSTWAPMLIAQVDVEPGEQVTADKLVTVFTSRDTPEPKMAVVELHSSVAREGYEALRAANEAAWASDWERCNVVIEGDDEADLALRYSLFQLLIAAPRHDERVSIAAKALSGFGYRGHVFWDTEIFILPFFTFTLPEIARNLLMYRYHTLPGARKKAKENGFEGSMFAWESAATGEETTPRWVPSPNSSELIRIWCGDIEHHITADIAYAVIQYWKITGDDYFMQNFGAEIVLEAARFWGSRVEWNEADGYYEINNVIGPDENHDHIDNNAFTNGMVRWNLQIALQVLSWLQHTAPLKAGELELLLDLNPKRLAHWQDVISRLYTGYDPSTRLFEQFEGFFQRKHVDLQDYEPRTKSMQALLGVEEAQQYQIIKQPDVLMLLYLLENEYDQQVLKTNWDYYTPRTDLAYGSSLGPAIQSILAARLGDIEAAYWNFMHAARTDLHDARRNTDEGIHAATAGGLWQAVVFGFGGSQLTPTGPIATPRFPAGWKRLAFKVQYRGERYNFDLHVNQPKSDLSGSTSTPFLGEENTADSPGFPILGAIFDLDGVLTDTSELHYQAWKRLADEEGFPFTREDNEGLRGVPRRDSLLLLLKGRPLPEERLQELMERKNRYYQEAIANLSPENLLLGARSLLEEIRAGGVKIAIGSASQNARPVIEKLGILPFIDAISDGYSVQRQKPAPDLFLHAASQLDLLPGQCIVFEDAEVGIAAALAGGMWAVGIGPKARVGAAHLVLPGLEGESWESILAGLRQSAKHRHKDVLQDPFI